VIVYTLLHCCSVIAEWQSSIVVANQWS